MEPTGKHEDETTQAASQSALELAHPYLELHLLLADGAERWLAFQRACLDLERQGLPWRREVQADHVSFHQGGKCQAVYPGECLESEGNRVWVIDARCPELAVLETYESPVGSRSWVLRAQAYRLGRKGSRRINHVEINHPTVSRSQASILPQGGRFEVLAESTSSPTCVNGCRLEGGQRVVLEHGDLLQVGEVALRFRQIGQAQVSGVGLNIRCLGHFSVEWGSLSLNEANWKGQKASWLLARLAWSWGQPVGAEYLIELLWPELPPLRGRKNLSQCIADLKSNLQIRDERQLLQRNSNCLQLLEDLPGDHDAGRLRELIHSSQPQAWEAAAALYAGAYLPNCFDSWAAEIRQSLHDGVVHCLERLARYQLSQGGWEAGLQSAQKGLEWEPCSQGLAQLAMEAALAGQRPELALRCYQLVTQRLRQDYQLEPSIELQRLAGLAESNRNV